MHVLCMYVYIDAPRTLGVLYMYVCMMYACIMYVCMYVRNSARYSARRSLIGALVGIDVSKVEYTCVADIRGRSINNSSTTFRPFINIAGDYHSSPCIHVPNSSQSPDSGFKLRVVQPHLFTQIISPIYCQSYYNTNTHFSSQITRSTSTRIHFA